MPVFWDCNLAQTLSGFLLISITVQSSLLKNLALFLCDEQPSFFCNSLTTSSYKVINSVKHSVSLLFIVGKYNCSLLLFIHNHHFQTWSEASLKPLLSSKACSWSIHPLECFLLTLLLSLAPHDVSSFIWTGDALPLRDLLCCNHIVEHAAPL